METWPISMIAMACIAFMFKAYLSPKSPRKPNKKLPPGPRGIPIISTSLWLRKSLIEVEVALRKYHSKFGPIITVHALSRPFIIIFSHSLAHQALVQAGITFADRPEVPPTHKIITSNQHNIASGAYGPTWRILRRNLWAQMLHASRTKHYSHGRKWALDILLKRLRAEPPSNGIQVIDHIRFSVNSLVTFMCFGEKLDESQISTIEALQHQLVFTRFQILNIWPSVTRVLMRSRWNELFTLLKKREEILRPYIKARRQILDETKNYDDHQKITCYVDTLLTLELREDNGTRRQLSEEELATNCSEFLTGGADTTSTTLQWIMANLVKYPDIQAKLYKDMYEIIGTQAKDIEEDQLPRIPYLKAIVLETLRRHPPGYFALPHAVTQEVELGGYTVPKNAIILFSVAAMGWDPEVWEDPLQFKPERFLLNQEQVDITGSREIKMMPFGAGRRLCPALDLAMLHLEHYVANLVWNFEWAASDGYEVDFSEKQEFSIVMKHPLQARITPRKTI